MSSSPQPGDFLVFQLESGYAMLRLLAVDETEGGKVWHVSAYRDLFIDVESAESAASQPGRLTVSAPHLALTNRAYESTQVAKIASTPLTEAEASPLEEWRRGEQPEISDRSIRLLLGLR